MERIFPDSVDIRFLVDEEEIDYKVRSETVEDLRCSVIGITDYAEPEHTRVVASIRSTLKIDGRDRMFSHVEFGGSVPIGFPLESRAWKHESEPLSEHTEKGGVLVAKLHYFTLAKNLDEIYSARRAK